MNMYVGITDKDWFKTLQSENCSEVNFWKPGGSQNFRALKEGELFLFKLHSPDDYIVGGGVFVKFSIIPSSLAWEAFGVANGVRSLAELNSRIYKYTRRTRESAPDPDIGCIILEGTFFLDESQWIACPSDWSHSIVQGKGYDSDFGEGRRIWNDLQMVLTAERVAGGQMRLEDSGFADSGDFSGNRYGDFALIRPRIGQGAFKIMITDAYSRRCAITGERTLPVLEAAHIKPYCMEGPHQVSNGILLRRDFHTLFDRGYLTIDEDMNVEVSRRIKEDFGNGHDYYTHHGKKLIVLPSRAEQLPEREFLRWHNERVYLG